MSTRAPRGQRRFPGRRPAEGGFTLVEAVVALALFAVVLASTALVVVHALNGTGTTNRAVTAVTVADQALENARNVAAQAAPGDSSALLSGRTAAVVDAVPVADLPLADTRIAYGPATAAGPTLPPVTTATVDGTVYTVRLVVGSCLRDRSGGACDQALTHASPVTLYRVVAAVTWPGCTARECPVTATTLVDPAPDPAYNALQDTLPVAVAKCFSTPAGRTLRFDPTYRRYSKRDSGDLGNAPVRLVSAPGTGTLTQNTGSKTWTYVPGPGTYDDQFTYKLVDRYNRVSDPVVVTLQVGGAC